MEKLLVGLLTLKVMYDGQGDSKDFLIVDIDSCNGGSAKIKEKVEGKLLSQYTSISGPGFFEEHKDLLNGNKSYWIKASGDISKEWFKALLIPLSHELRNPLASIAAGTKLMEITCNDEETHKTVMIIKRQVEQLTSLVDDLLDISRIEQKMIKFKKQDMVLNTTIINSIESMRAEFNRMGVDLIDEIEEHPILVNADNIRMSQCIHNILVNALKFTDKGGRVKTSLHKEGNQAVITVKDNGIGISSNMLELIFKTFSQDHTSSQISNNMGLGLGLSIVKDIIEMHGGQADVYSKGLGQGSTFTLKIPTI